ncbi:hypothetical protein AB0D04_40765 [Streptomyces sp. NPDC048483]|uniref:hypothetical protein n=1 Tax=Streptomyces sp. NPDC048483 TaxID=3154927 RepID=UPI00341C2CBF
MDREQRRAILGDKVIAHIRAQVAAAPPPTPDLIARLQLPLASRRRAQLAKSLVTP